MISRPSNAYEIAEKMSKPLLTTDGLDQSIVLAWTARQPWLRAIAAWLSVATEATGAVQPLL